MDIIKTGAHGDHAQRLATVAHNIDLELVYNLKTEDKLVKDLLMKVKLAILSLVLVGLSLLLLHKV